MIATDPPEMATWLAAARAAIIADAYTLISTNGTTARWIDADADFTLPDGRVFERGPQFERGNISQRIGLSVDTLQLTITPVYRDQQVTFGAQTLLQAAQRGALRGATLQMERLVFDGSLSDYKGRWIEFAGTLSVRSTAGGKIDAQVLSELNLLDQPMPRDVYQTQCKNTVFDKQCGLERAAWANSGSVSAATAGERSQFTTASSGVFPVPAGWYDQGVVQFLTGANAGEKRTVKAFSAGVFTFALPWPQDIGVGDTFSVVPGCNRSLDACTNKFANRIHFRAEPFIPQPETVT